MTLAAPAPPRQCAPSVPTGYRAHRIADGDTRAHDLAEQCRREVAHLLRVDVAEVQRMPDAALPRQQGWVLVRAQWLPHWRRS